MSTVVRRMLLVGSFLVSQLTLLLILAMPASGGSWLQAFRGYFAYDQLSYAAITSTTAAGVGGLPEPFTETGHSYYPSLWYRILGWLSSLTGWSTAATWTIAGYVLLAASVAFIGWVAFRVSRLPWAPALVGPALLVGTLSIVFHDNWYTTLDSHAVLWGPYGALYVLNAEVAGFACVGAGLALLIWGSVTTGRRQIVLFAVAALLLGLTANLQTYIFFVGAGIAFAWLGALGLVRSRSRKAAIATLIVVVATLVLGNAIASAIGALPVYALLIACTIPGALMLVKDSWRALLVPAIVFVLAAAPQAAVVASGILRKDPFLTYRQDVSSDLGVPLWAALLASLPLIAIWSFNVAVQRRHANDIVRAALAGMVFSTVMLTFNNVWGFGQEPYRMWIDSVVAGVLLLAPLTAWNISLLRRQHAAPATPTEPDAGDRAPSRLILVTGVAALVLFAVSLLDFGAFRTYVGASGMIPFDTARYDALRTLTSGVDGLLTTGPCLDPQETKIVTRKPVAFYNLGIAWPENKAAIDAVVDAQRAGTFAPDAMRAAGVRYLVTDSACATSWPVDNAMGIVKAQTLPYSDATGSGELTLWKLLA